MSTDSQSINWYNDNAEKYTAHVRDSKSSLYHTYYEKPAMYRLLPELSGKSVLSLGCGSGEDSNYLKLAGAKRSLGIDISSGMLQQAHSAYPECGFAEMNMEHLQLGDSTFDFAYSSLAIHYIEDWSQTFAEVYRVLKPNSYFLFSCNHPTNYAMEKTETDESIILKLEIRKNKKNGIIETSGNYLQRSKLIDVLGANSVNTWHKPLHEICSEAQSAGFIIDRIIEPRPLQEMETIRPDIFHQLNTIPGFLIFRLLKQ